MRIAQAELFLATDRPVRFKRPSVYGLCAREGRLAVVRIACAQGFKYGLPGGGLNPGEWRRAALIREFREETGLEVAIGARIGGASQKLMHGGLPIVARATFYEATPIAHFSPSEPDHSLVWMDPWDAALHVRHEFHSWAILSWLKVQA